MIGKEQPGRFVRIDQIHLPIAVEVLGDGRPCRTAQLARRRRRQLVAIARAAFWGGKLLLLDEPTAALGVRESREVLELIKRLSSRGITIVMVTHELDIANFARRKVVMRDGVIRTDERVSNRAHASEALAQLQEEQRAVQLV